MSMRYSIALIIFSGMTLLSCSPAEGNRRGHEFMPDMVHPTGYEANLYDYYYYNRWGTKEEYKTYVMPRLSVPGTIARGESSVAGAADENARMEAYKLFGGDYENAFAFIPNGKVAYPYANNEQERARATREITKNPFPITTKGLDQGKQLYDIYCGICHGPNGDGQGYLVRDEDPSKGITAGIYPAAPANLVQDTFVNASAGRIYHAIMHGKNVMGPYADKLTYLERWNVIHYIRSLQAKAKRLEYSETANTFNQEALPYSLMTGNASKNVSVVADTAALKPEGHESNMNNH